MAEQISSLL